MLYSLRRVRCIHRREGVARATDLAAAQLILAEAGGVSVTPEGRILDLALNATSTASIIAVSNPLLCKNMLERLGVDQNRG